MNEKVHKYSLKKGSHKEQCPKCGRTKCFKPYIDNESGEVLHSEVGRCDHELSCGYHYTPHEYFRDHPEARDIARRIALNQVSFACQKPVASTRFVQTQFFPLRWPQEMSKRSCTFRRWMESLSYPHERIQQVLAEYYVGATINNVCVSGICYGTPVIFWQIDEQQQVHDAKLMAYQTNGHRVQGWGNSMRAMCVKVGKGPQLDETEKVLFGQHLLPRYPDKTVCIVESEKTALVCACHYPEYLWLASGGCGNLQPEKLRPLFDRRVVVFPDSGELHKWSEQMKKSGHPNYRLAEFLEDYPPNTDLADVLLGDLSLMTKVKSHAASQDSTSEPTSVTFSDVPEAKDDAEQYHTPEAIKSLEKSAAEKFFDQLAAKNPALLSLQETFGLDVDSVGPIEQPQQQSLDMTRPTWLRDMAKLGLK